MSNPERPGGYGINPENDPAKEQALEYCRLINRSLDLFHELELEKIKLRELESELEVFPDSAEIRSALSRIPAVLEGIRFRAEEAARSVIENSVWEELKFHLHITIPENEDIRAETSRGYVPIDREPPEFIALQVHHLDEGQIVFYDPGCDLYLTVYENRHKLKVQPIFRGAPGQPPTERTLRPRPTGL